MCQTGQCKYEESFYGVCTWDWGEGVAPPDGGCFPTEQNTADFAAIQRDLDEASYRLAAEEDAQAK